MISYDNKSNETICRGMAQNAEYLEGSQEWDKDDKDSVLIYIYIYIYTLQFMGNISLYSIWNIIIMPVNCKM